MTAIDRAGSLLHCGVPQVRGLLAIGGHNKLWSTIMKQAAANNPGSDIEHPQKPAHSDNEKSKMPERNDEARKQAPSDRPGKMPGEGEPPVG
jgi:hypothetical protein